MSYRYGIGHLSLIPLRSAPSHKSELVSQLLLGETFAIIEQQSDWYYISHSSDHYNGWIEEKQFIEIDEADYKKLRNQTRYLCGDVMHHAHCVYKTQTVLMGSPLPFFDKGQFNFLDETYTFRAEAVDTKAEGDKRERVKHLALKLLNAPYLWGGRSFLGIDCSGYAQLILKMVGIDLYRDASQQASQGELLYFLHQALPGDLAFFDNEENEITHVGILLNNNQIIHAHGQVRIDSIDQQGIYNNEQRKYTHSLRLIKRFLSA